MVRVLLALLLSAPASSALAGGFHEALGCTECHVAVRAGDRASREWAETGLCLRCHDGGTTIPDVLRDAPAMIAAGIVTPERGRSAGGLNALGDGAGAASHGYGEHAGHTLGSTEPPPGFVGTWPSGTRLTCRSCHAVHDNGAYRNLGADPVLRDPDYLDYSSRVFGSLVPPSYELVESIGGAAPGGADVAVERRPAGGPAYDAAGVALATRRGRNAMDEFCASCHTRFHGDANTRRGGEFVRHPTTGVVPSERVRNALSGAVHPPRVARGDGGAREVSCLTCHAAHGTRNAFGLVHWDASSSRNGEDGAGAAVETLCRTCHQWPRTASAR